MPNHVCRFVHASFGSQAILQEYFYSMCFSAQCFLEPDNQSTVAFKSCLVVGTQVERPTDKGHRVMSVIALYLIMCCLSSHSQDVFIRELRRAERRLSHLMSLCINFFGTEIAVHCPRRAAASNVEHEFPLPSASRREPLSAAARAGARCRWLVLTTYIAHLLRVRRAWARQGEVLKIIASTCVHLERKNGKLQHARAAARNLWKRVFALVDWKSTDIFTYPWRTPLDSAQ